MGTATVTAGVDTWAGSGRPALEHGDDRFLRLEDGVSNAYIFLKSPVPRGATVTSAVLRVRARNASTGSRTITARRISESWKASKLNWNNKPGVVGASATDTIGSVANGDVIEFDVTAHLQSVADGSPHYGWRITTDASTAHKLYGLNAGVYKPTLTVEWSDKPDAPTTLVPSGASVSVTKPTLTFDYTDVSGSMDLVAVQVQIDATNNFVSGIDFDSGEVATEEPMLDLTTTAYAGLANAATTYWRVRVKDAAGLWSDWSDSVSFTRTDFGTLTIDNPAASPNNFVLEATPPIMWTYSGAQVAWMVRILDTDGRELYTSGKRTGTETSHTLPIRTSWHQWPRPILHDGETYVVEVRVWDSINREATPGAPAYAVASREFTMEDEVGVTAPSSLSATQDGATPVVELAWTRATAPDGWTILRDGRVIDAAIDAADLFVSGTSYAYRDTGASPYEQHTYNVRAVVNGESSPKSSDATVTPKVEGVWLVDFDRDLMVCFRNAGGIESWRMSDQAAVYYPVGGSAPVQITTAMRGVEGSFTGMLRRTADLTLEAQEAVVWALKERPDTTIRLIASDLSIPVVVRNVSLTPHPQTHPDDVRKLVYFEFFQVDDLPFTARF